MHSAAESARWSNWPGRYSTANSVVPAPSAETPCPLPGPPIRAPATGSSRVAISTCGSENTVGMQRSKSSSSMPSTS